MEDREKAFWDRVDRRGPNECWPWTRGTSEGYGRVSVGGARRYEYTHRLAFKLSGGDLKPGEYVLHSCDNRRCCNPAHLRAGSHLENIAEAVARNRYHRGSQAHNSKLSEAAVAEIRASTARHKDLAAKYGVHETTILRVRKAHLWRHQPDASQWKGRRFLTPEMARAIAATPGTLAEVGRKFGVHGATVLRARRIALSHPIAP